MFKDDPNRPIALEDVAKLKYAEAIVKERRQEVEKTIMHGELNTKRMDLLTSLIIANTKYDPHPQEKVDPSLARPMTDDEIRGVMFDAFVAGTDTVSSNNIL